MRKKIYGYEALNNTERARLWKVWGEGLVAKHLWKVQGRHEFGLEMCILMYFGWLKFFNIEFIVIYHSLSIYKLCFSINSIRKGR